MHKVKSDIILRNKSHACMQEASCGGRPSTDGNTPLHFCASRGHRECTKVMLKINASIFMKNRIGKSPLDIARGVSRQVLEDYIERN